MKLVPVTVEYLRIAAETISENSRARILAREYGCAWCGRPTAVHPALRVPVFNHRLEAYFICEACLISPAARGGEVFSAPYTGLRWLRKAVREAFAEQKPRVYSAQDALLFLVRGEYRGVFDHFGSDVDGNLISEPYMGDEMPGAAKLAAKLNVKFTYTRPSWHAPYMPDCVRITFLKPEGAR